MDINMKVNAPSGPICMTAKPVMAALEEELRQHRIKAYRVVIFSNGEDPASVIYVNNKRKKFKEFGVQCDIFDLNRPEYSSPLFIESIVEILKEEKVPYMFQLPLPNWCKPYQERWINNIPAPLDMDSMGNAAIGAFYRKPTIENCPCTPLGVIKLLEFYLPKEKLENKNVVIIGRSAIVGRPLGRLMESRYNATVTLCHSKTANLDFYSRAADIVVCATGQRNLLRADMVKDGVILVDVGITREEKKIYGDICMDEAMLSKCYAYTPVPGGVGPMTVEMLIYKLLERS